jgi:hypothetical protein
MALKPRAMAETQLRYSLAIELLKGDFTIR